jgi:hypothetical protein
VSNSLAEVARSDGGGLAHGLEAGAQAQLAGQLAHGAGARVPGLPGYCSCGRSTVSTCSGSVQCVVEAGEQVVGIRQRAVEAARRRAGLARCDERARSPPRGRPRRRATVCAMPPRPGSIPQMAGPRRSRYPAAVRRWGRWAGSGALAVLVAIGVAGPLLARAGFEGRAELARGRRGGGGGARRSRGGAPRARGPLAGAAAGSRRACAGPADGDRGGVRGGRRGARDPDGAAGLPRGPLGAAGDARVGAWRIRRRTRRRTRRSRR